MVSRERHGNLLCIRVRWPVSKEDMARFLAESQRMREDAARTGVPPVTVVAVDLRTGEVVPQEAALGFLSAMRSESVVRLAVITKADAAIQNMQAKRLVREAGEGRQTFHDTDEARRWLGEALAPDEQSALARFLAVV